MQFLKAFWQRIREKIEKSGTKYLFAGLILVNIFIWQAVFAEEDTNLKVYFLDVGQGDAIFIEAPNGNQVLIDGGVGSKILSELGSILPIYDRSIDVLIESHPDQDHIGGFPDVLQRYDIGLYVEPGVETDKSFDKAIDQILEKKSIPKVLARREQMFDLGDGVYLLILFPDRSVTQSETNEASIVAKLLYGDTSFLLTGDSPIKIEKYLLSLNSKILDSDVLKVGHHGSRTSTSIEFLDVVSPHVAVISAGKENRYGHPHEEVLEVLRDQKVLIKRIDEEGRIKVTSDGVKIEFGQ